MSSPIVYETPKNRWLLALFLFSIGLHVAVAFLVVWAGRNPGSPSPPKAMLDLGMDVQLGLEVQELIAAESVPIPEPPTPPPPEPPEPPPPEPLPEVMDKPDFPEPVPAKKATPFPHSKTPQSKPASAIPRTTNGPTPRPGIVGGNVTKGALTGTPGGQKVGTQGWRTPRPPYPPVALASRIQGRGAVRISTDATGNVVQVTVTQPINPILDANTRTFARANWKGPPNATRIVPVIYQIR